MKTLLTATLGLITFFPAGAQTLNLNLDTLAAKAKEKAEITLDRSMLTLALQAAPEKVKGSVADVSSFVLRHYEFDKPGQFSNADLEPIRKQVSSGTGWSRVFNVKDGDETVEIYALSQGGKSGGFLLIAAEKKELTVVQVVGSIELASLEEVVKSTIAYDLTKTAKGN